MTKHTHVLGKLDRNGETVGRRNCEARLTWEWDGRRFSASAEIWNHIKTHVFMCGQCLEEVVKYFPHDKKAQSILKVWRRYHLNDMNTACEHQRALGQMWLTHPLSECETCGYKLGTAWKFEEIPADVVAEIEGWSTPLSDENF